MRTRAALQPPERIRIGKGSRIQTELEATFIRLNIPEDEAPLGGPVALRPDANRNHNARYSLVLPATANDYDLPIRISSDITDQAHAEAGYILVDRP